MSRYLSHIVSVLVVLGLFSCRKEVSTENPNGRNGTFMAQIDGTQWIAADNQKGATIAAGFISITGLSADNKQLGIILNDTVPGVYTLDQNTTSVAAYANKDSADLYAYTSNQGSDTSQAGGTVTVTAIDPVNKTITGTFFFNAYRNVDGKEKKITEGVFYKLPYSSSLPEANKGDTMHAVIDGQNWMARSILASNFSNTLVINGSALNGAQAITLILPFDIAPGGPYMFDNMQFTYTGVYSPVINSTFGAASGTLNILENDPTAGRIRGNFEFLATDPTFQDPKTYQLSSGYFSVQY
ncbi:DUF6252 family protein [Flavitalea sp. BT771]|uniref:DUF6252 family protein n=1 Tax=Flavitalea sp. BT771 TaxID=3063329 RepID=UPI0026E133C9|nr:DUF6252 family protein [Flavitalea sp. BT771]MDO6434295.1 DUF6252 family protein [Flavitalea sp. BT771]MDV6223195.1 DUF6252 family protein [Flavitalea sp. BT771]